MFSDNKLENAAFILVYLASVVVLVLDLVYWRAG